MALNLIFMLVFALLGAIISITFGFLSVNSLTYVLYVALFSTLASALLGYVVYRVLEERLPEVLELMRSALGLASADLAGVAGAEGAGEGGDSSLAGEAGADVASPILEGVDPKKTQEYGDHIMVDQIKIKNEPKLMAEAIRTLLARDS